MKKKVIKFLRNRYKPATKKQENHLKDWWKTLPIHIKERIKKEAIIHDNIVAGENNE